MFDFRESFRVRLDSSKFIRTYSTQSVRNVDLRHDLSLCKLNRLLSAFTSRHSLLSTMPSIPSSNVARVEQPGDRLVLRLDLTLALLVRIGEQVVRNLRHARVV